MKTFPKIVRIVTAVVVVTVLLAALLIMGTGAGTVEGYDFGAGAYYYADIPGFETIMRDYIYRTSVPVVLHVALFLVWGWLMYRLWVKVDGR